MKKNVASFLFCLICFIFLISLFSFCGRSSVQKINYSDTTLKTYLALGDSYTIGESVPAAENYPHQLRNALQKSGIRINEPEIRAVTGWTTGDLIASLREMPPRSEKYDLVTLLIGVNNQFQGRTIKEYEIEFRFLLKEAIQYAGDKKNVIVLSIPDYGVMPFAEGRDTREISKGIDEFNSAQKKIAEESGVTFIDITGISRKAKTNQGFRAQDGLHPSGEQYTAWVGLLLDPAKEALK